MEKEEWKPFRNALDKSNRKKFDDIWDNQCEDPVSFDGKFATENQEMYCSEEGFGGELIQSENTGNRWQCVIYEFEQAAQVCDVGELNEETGMCEVRPGRNNNNNNNNST